MRAFRLPVAPATALRNLLATVSLFTPELTRAVPARAAERNVAFLRDYAHFEYPGPGTNATTDLDASAVRSGDFIGIVRFDGLDPLLAWAMGSTTGHTTQALWFDDDGDGADDALYVVESQAIGTYWPYMDGVQRTPWATWVARARAAGFNAVHVPLSDAAAAKYNVSAARAFFLAHQGIEYGYVTLLYSWLDTLADNLPCLPPAFQAGGNCLSWPLVETLFGLLDRAAPPLADALWIGAWNHRVDPSGGAAPVVPALRTPELLQAADAQGTPGAALPALPESDEWLYTTYQVDQASCDEDTKTCNRTLTTGRTMVCCVFVCNVWKAAGLFDDVEGGRDAVSCGEQTNADVYVHCALHRALRCWVFVGSSSPLAPRPVWQTVAFHVLCLSPSPALRLKRPVGRLNEPEYLIELNQLESFNYCLKIAPKTLTRLDRLCRLGRIHHRG